MLETTALTCPNCGNPNNIVTRDVKYGYEFSCTFCNTTSVITINLEAYIPRPNERICVHCGRIHPPEALTCDCGAGLTRVCVDPDCRRVFSIHRLVCEHCGFPQHLHPNSPEGQRFKGEMALRELAGPDERSRRLAANTLARMGQHVAYAVSFLEPVIENDTVNASIIIQGLREKAATLVPALLKRLRFLEYDTAEASAVCKALASIGAEAREALPALVEIIDKAATQPNNTFVSVVSHAFQAIQVIRQAARQDIPDGLVEALAKVLVESPFDLEVREACYALAELGPAASAAAEPLREIFFTRPAPRWMAWDVLIMIGQAHPEMLTQLIADWPDEAERACQALAEMGERAAVVIPDLLALLDQWHLPEAARVSAADALVRMGEPAVPPLVDLLRDHAADRLGEYAAYALGKIGQPALDEMIKLAKSGDTPVRILACRALAKMDSADPAKETLRDIATGWFTPDEVKDAARAALSRLEMRS